MSGGRVSRKGSTIGSVIPTKGAVIPAAVGVDIGCGMMAVRTSLTPSDLPDDLGPVRAALENAVPHGHTVGRSKRDKVLGGRYVTGPESSGLFSLCGRCLATGFPALD